MTTEPHNLPRHLNIFKRDHDSVITGYGIHDRVLAFLPGPNGLYCRVDHVHNLGMPTPEQVMTVSRKDQGVRGEWKYNHCEVGDESTGFYFDPA